MFAFKPNILSLHSAESIKFELSMRNQYKDRIDKYYPMCLDFVNRGNNVKHTVLTMKQCYFIFPLIDIGHQFKTNPFREYQ